MGRVERLLRGERLGKFLREVGSIVLGVLVALGLGAIATEIGWRSEVSNARETVRREISNNLALAKERSAVRACVDRRLDELAVILAEASRTRKLPPLGAISSAGRPGFSSSAWRSFEAAQVVAHFPTDEHLALGSFYSTVDTYRANVADDSAAWRSLAMMVGPGRALDPATEGALYEALGNARYTNARLGTSLEWFSDSLKTAGIPSEFASPDAAGAFRAPARSICKPIEAEIPLTYGQDVSAGRANYRVVPGRPSR